MFTVSDRELTEKGTIFYKQQYHKVNFTLEPGMFYKFSYVTLTSAICDDVVVTIKFTLTSLSHSNLESALISYYIKLGNHSIFD